MKMTIEEMMQVESAKAELEKLALQVSAREAAAKQAAVNDAAKDFKAYFAAKKFEITGHAWNIAATYGSIVFKLAIKNSSAGGLECMTLHFPEMTKMAPLDVYLEAKPDKSAATAAQPAANQSLLAEIRARMDKMLERLNSPTREWFFYSNVPEDGATRRKEYATFTRFLNEECP
ncbi:MAG TPA: hypothetical protein VF472_23955 [Burkholderiaceae bacterium]